MGPNCHFLCNCLCKCNPNAARSAFLLVFSKSGGWFCYLFAQPIQPHPTLQPHGLYPPAFSVDRVFAGKPSGVGCRALLPGIFPTQGSNPGLPPCRWILQCLSHLMKLLFFPWLKLSLLFFTVSVCVPDIGAPEIRAWGSAGQPGATPVIAQARKTPPGSHAPCSWTPAGAALGRRPSLGCLLAGIMVPGSPGKPARGPSTLKALQLPSQALAPRASVFSSAGDVTSVVGVCGTRFLKPI